MSQPSAGQSSLGKENARNYAPSFTSGRINISDTFRRATLEVLLTGQAGLEILGDILENEVTRWVGPPHQPNPTASCVH